MENIEERMKIYTEEESKEVDIMLDMDERGEVTEKEAEQCYEKFRMLIHNRKVRARSGTLNTDDLVKGFIYENLRYIMAEDEIEDLIAKKLLIK